MSEGSSPPGTMTFWEHLDELRSRLFRSALAVAVTSIAAWYYKEPLLRLLTEPFIAGWKAKGLDGPAALHFPAPADMFVAYMKLAFVAGFIGAAPILLYQLWMFIAPGLYAKEKRLALPFVLSSTLLFAAGAYFGWRVVIPLAFTYLLDFSGAVSPDFRVVPTVMVGDYIEFISQMLIGFGLSFELPVLVVFLTLAGIINHRHLIRFGRYFVVIAFIIAAILTPPDVQSQTLMAVPLLLLYGISIGLSWLVGRRRTAPTESVAEEDAPR